MTSSPKHQEKPNVGITLGDLNGIGPEVVIKSLQDHRILNYITPIVYGSAKVLSFYKKAMNIEELNYSQVKSAGQFFPKNINVVNCWEDQIEITPGKPTKESGRAALLALKQAAADLKNGLIDTLVTAPIDKHNIHNEEFPFKGHTEFLADFFGTSNHMMVLLNHELRVGLITEHIPIKDVSEKITRERLVSKIGVIEQSLKKDFGINKPRIALLGLNPHAGDSGLIGNEDESILKPLISELKNSGKLIFGPYPSDSFFATLAYKKFDAVLAMYHDQGLIPFKSIAFENGVNFTAGLTVERTSPDHGTAFNIAGKNIASHSSMSQAIYMAIDIFKRRSEMISEK